MQALFAAFKSNSLAAAPSIRSHQRRRSDRLRHHRTGCDPSPTRNQRAALQSDRCTIWRFTLSAVEPPQSAAELPHAGKAPSRTSSNAGGPPPSAGELSPRAQVDAPPRACGRPQSVAEHASSGPGRRQCLGAQQTEQQPHHSTRQREREGREEGKGKGGKRRGEGRGSGPFAYIGYRFMNSVLDKGRESI